VHIPFCAHHCGYCDFAVVTGQDHHIDMYIAGLAAELSQLGTPQPVRTLFLGGGTPTYLSCRQLEVLLTTIRRWLPPEPGHEFSVEANPGTLDAAKVAVLEDHGVNRLSLGAQSFHPHLLRVLERNHAPADVGRSLDAAGKRIGNISLDLIFGVPGQTLAEWRADLDQGLAFQPAHVSTYGLTFEKGTRLWKQQAAGALHALGEEAELAMYLEAMDRLESAGFEHYEISSFARPGCRCRHNQVYWANEAYFGFGVGAARYVEGCRGKLQVSGTVFLRHGEKARPEFAPSCVLPRVTSPGLLQNHCSKFSRTLSIMIHKQRPFSDCRCRQASKSCSTGACSGLSLGHGYSGLGPSPARAGARRSSS